MSRHPPEIEALAPERYELREPPLYRFDVDRRTFLGLLGAGAVVTVGRTGTSFAAAGDTSNTIDARLHLGEDGLVTVLTGKVEFGQGSRTQIAMAAAEELNLPIERVKVVMADTAIVPVDGGTWGSQTTPRTVPAVRQAAAAAREALVRCAANSWNLDPALLDFENGQVFERGIDKDEGRSFSLSELASSPSLQEDLAGEMPENVQVTRVAEWKTLGTSQTKSRAEAMVTGAHRFPSDIRRPHMLYGRVLRPPAFGATLRTIDVETLDSSDGAIAVRDGSFVGCAAPTTREADLAVSALSKTARWNRVDQPSSSELFGVLRDGALGLGAQEGQDAQRRPRVRERGEPDVAMASATQRRRAQYEIGYIQHVPLEPRAAVAEWQDGRLTVWTGTQNPHGVRAELATAFRLSNDRVRVVVPDTGGGFGGKHTGECAVEAARLAKATGRPVSLQWTRREELTWAYFRPAAVISITAGLDRDDKVVAWDHENINGGTAALASPYGWSHERAKFHYCDAPLREGSYRAIGATANNFARECFVDELATAAGRDPLAYKLEHLNDDRLAAVLKAAADRFEWASTRKENRGIGIAGGTEKGSYVATCVEVEVEAESDDAFRIARVCVAFECGAIQNPSNLMAQVEGAVIMGLGGALWEESRFEGGRILNDRLAQYRVPRFSDVPPIETVLVDRPDLDSVGAGETPIIALAPAIANALWDAIGVRVRAMPLQQGLERVRRGTSSTPSPNV